MVSFVKYQSVMMATHPHANDGNVKRQDGRETIISPRQRRCMC